MKLRINNENLQPLRIILEPWATEFELKSGDFIDFMSYGKVSENGYFQVEHNACGIIIYPEWDGALVQAYNSCGEKID